MTRTLPVHRLIVRPLADRPDAELLDRFIRYAETPAFDELVRRHGPMVYAVCRRGSAQPADVDDAFQATFLVFLRKVRTLRDPGRLGPWLYGVAVRVAAKARQRTRPTAEATGMIPDLTPPAADRDWLPLLDRELAALPAKYREPVVLCELQGASRAEAAKRLGVKEGTLSSRLSRGRELLRKRLLKHGTLLPAGGLVSLIGAAKPVPAATVAKLTEAAGGTVPAAVLTLTEDAMRSLFVAKLKLAVGVMVVGVVAGLTATAPAGEKPMVMATKAEVRHVGAGKAAATGDSPIAGGLTGDLAKMQGVWDLRFESIRPDGPPQPVEQVSSRNYVHDDTIWVIENTGGTAHRYQIVIDDTRDPKRFDYVGPDGTHRGIYRTTDSGWEVVLSIHTKIRPAQFDDDGSARLTRNRFTRPKTPPKPISADRKALLGRWSIVRQEYPHDDFSRMVTKGAGGVIEVLPEYMFIQRPADDKKSVWEAVEYSLDASKPRPWIDLTFPGKPTSNATGFGVYELTGDTLRISYRVGLPRALRTLDFVSGIEETGYPNSNSGPVQKVGCGLLELKREK
jgi:RNA polymerase sigma factor (sigma-70 family)